MTMIDEETLRAALQGAADSIAVPDRAVDQILMVAQRLDARPRAARRFRRRPDSGLDTAVVAKQRRSESGPLDVTRQRRRPPRRVLVAAAAIVVLGVSLAVVTTLDGSRTSRLAISPTPTTTAGPPLRLAAPSEHGSATRGASRLDRWSHRRHRPCRPGPWGGPRRWRRPVRWISPSATASSSPC